MSQLTQHGQHPDADQLTAFVEQALPPHEREQTLAHLATCADCRAIVALSLPPLQESPAPLPNLGAPQPALSLPKGLDSETWDGEPKTSRRPWFSTWHLAWPTAAAFGALAFVIIHLHNTARTVTPPTETATSQPPTPLSTPPPAPSASTPSPAAKPEPPNQTATGSAKAPTQDIKAKSESIPNLPLANRSYTAYVTPQPPPTAVTINNQQATSDAAQTATQSQPAIPAPRPQPNTIIAGAAPATASPAPQSTSKARVAAPSPQAAGGGAAVSFAADPNASPTRNAINGYNLALSSTNLSPAAPLPSHLAALSTAINGHQVLAIDTQNTLFYSEDDGKHWTSVPSQWRGRAIRVNLARPIISLQQKAAIAITEANLTTSNNSSVASATPNTAPSITGTITDATGAVIPNTSITINNPTTRTTRTATSDRNGRYLVDNLTPGNYQLEASAPGFQKQQLAINVAAQQNQANLTLAVGAASETVTVEASAQTVPLATPRVALKKSAPPAPPKPTATPLFEITTDNGDHWTSLDGKAWTQMQPQK